MLQVLRDRTEKTPTRFRVQLKIDIYRKTLQKIWKQYQLNLPDKYMFVVYLWNIPMIYSHTIRKKFPMKFRGIFPNDVPGILNLGIFPECSMIILRMFHAFF